MTARSASDDPHAGQAVLTAGRPLGQSRAAVIMIHGRNAGPADILGLAGELRHPAFTYLAPAAAGGTWYPYSFLAPRQDNEPGLSSGLGVIESILADLAGRGIRQEHVLLLGFSQGACLSSEFAFRHPGRYGGLVIFSGGVIGPPGTTFEATGAFAGTPVFFGCSDVDPHIPLARVDETAAVFHKMGARVDKRIYPGMGHLVNDDEIAAARTMMDAVLASAEKPSTS